MQPQTATEAARPPTTTASQRRVNLIWEITQALIAVAVTCTTLYVAAALSTKGEGESAAFLLLSNAFFLVIGFYFGRTNHARAGDNAIGSQNR